MNQNKCDCGRSIPQRCNSTIRAKKCPHCTYMDAISNAKIKSKTQSKSKNKQPKFNFYKTTAWKWFRKYVLLYYSDKNGIVKCATSGRYMTLGSKNCHCGHYIKVRDGNSTNYSTALDFRNAAPQHLQDNTMMGGRQDLMREFLVNQHGDEAIKKLEAKRRIPLKLDKSTLDQYAKHYKAKFEQLLKERNQKNPWK